MNVFVGTSGYSYKEWKGDFYPEGLPDREMLRYYATRLNAVEINNTFYRFPKESVLTGWGEQVPEAFRFVLKASRKITHFKRLKGTEEETEYLTRTVRVLGNRLGVVFFQLPPNLKADLPRLKDFLSQIPKDLPAAFEFRHQSWFTDELFDTLRQHNVSLCIADADGDLEVPFVSTADHGYLRLRKEEYTAKDLKEWAGRIAGESWKDCFVFFKHEDEAAGPKMAGKFLDLVS